MLRAEIDERKARERIYFIRIVATDSSGNSDTAVRRVVVSRHHRRDHWVAQEEDKDNEDVGFGKAGPAVNGLDVSVHPNPTRQAFILVLRSNDNRPILVRVVDNFGRLVETRTNIQPGGELQIGSGYRPGNYYVQAIQGEDRVTLQLVKLAN
ncbi:T9SS type A sorting domain-containing protein [Puia sp. P3]|uniref:T9SS type A sorting domain-containing protein n=1 Tax=Puia sp. P3 TaxID=3423952 RepID=UPI003D671EA5